MLKEFTLREITQERTRAILLDEIERAIDYCHRVKFRVQAARIAGNQVALDNHTKELEASMALLAGLQQQLEELKEKP